MNLLNEFAPRKSLASRYSQKSISEAYYGVIKLRNKRENSKKDDVLLEIIPKKYYGEKYKDEILPPGIVWAPYTIVETNPQIVSGYKTNFVKRIIGRIKKLFKL